jgi:osmotically-inducible protein OsmY
MKTDAQLKKDVITELEWDPAINASEVGVAVTNGVVTLTGHLDLYAKKYAIEKAVTRVEGVKAIAVEMDVKLEPGHKRSDTEIAAAVESALKWHALVPDDQIQVKVEKGWVTLRGQVSWDYQRQSAQKAVHNLVGVVGVSNAITLKPAVTPDNIANREAKNIEITVHNSSVTLHGKVDSWSERAAAAGAAWDAPGISRVVNELTVGV